MSFGNSVWERADKDIDFTGKRVATLPKRLYIGLLTFWVVAGLVASSIGARWSYEWEPSWLLIIGCFIPAIVGIFIAMGSNVPIVSLIGYALVVFPFGVMLGPVVAQYTEASVIKVIGTTAIVSVGCGGVGVIYPKSLESWGGYLFGALLLLIIGQFATLILGAFGLPVEGALTVFDWIGVFLFSAYIIYDMNRALRIPRTLDNSIDCAVAVYLDIINLFIRLLSLMGQKK